MHSLTRIRFATALALSAFASACTTAEEGSTSSRSQAHPANAASPAPDAAPPAPNPWTDAFQARAVLIADEVRIEGPPGLLEHVVIKQEPEVHVYSIKATDQGLLQEAVLRDEILHAPIEAHLDALQIAAEKRLVVLERPGAVPVIVEATGSVFFQNVGDATEKREDSLRLVGELTKVP